MVSCLGFINPTHRAQFASPEACAAKLPFSSPRRSVQRLVDMSYDEQWQIRVVPAGHPLTPQDVLERLATDEHYQVRSWVVRNLSTNDDTLRILEQDVDSRIAAYARLRLSNTVSEADG